MNEYLDVLSGGSSILLLIMGILAFVFVWFNSSEEQKRKYIDDLVHSAQQQFLDKKTGEERMAFVLAEVQKRWPRFPVEIARNIAEAAVKRMKDTEGVTLFGELEAFDSDQPAQ